MRRLLRISILLAVGVASAGCSPQFAPAKRASQPEIDRPLASIHRVSLRYSNVYLLRGASGDVVLVDAGGPGDIERTTTALSTIGLRPSDVRAVVLTHGHGDHAGMGLFFQKNGAKIVVGRGDEMQTTVGHNDEMTPTGLFARVLKPFVKLDYDPFTPDVFVDDAIDLKTYGLPGVTVRHMPGHTRGSLAILVGRREAIVGDMMLGGVWGGIFHEETAGDHYYQLDSLKNKCNVQALLDEGIETFHLGHGGPVSRDAVLQWTKSWGDVACPASR